MGRLQRVLVETGIVLPALFILSNIVFYNAHYHTGWREASASAGKVSLLLEVFWLLAAISLALRGWKQTGRSFRFTLAANLFLALAFVVTSLLNWP